MSNIFPNIKLGCYCINRRTAEKPEICLCGPEERIIRAYIDEVITDPMTPEQRGWCVSSADWAGEGHYNRPELEAMNDRDLARALMNAWHMYAQSQY